MQGASDGDTIEVRGNGPFVSQPIKVTRALSIRAAAGSRPVIQLSPEAVVARADLLETKAPLIVEGLELQIVPEALDKREGRHSTIILARAPLYVANCRLLAKQPFGTTVINYGPICELRNCEIIGPTVYGIGSYYTPHLRLNLDNCCGCLANGIKMHYLQYGAVDYTQDSTIRLTRNTFVAPKQFVIFSVYPGKVTNLWTKDLLTKPMRCETEGNILDTRLGVALFSQTPPGKILPPGEAEASLPQVFTWHGTRNLYAVAGHFLSLLILPNEYPAAVNPIRSVAEWGKYWGTAEAGSIEGRVRYQGGDLLARLAVAPEKLTPEDFRLRTDSAGYRAGKDGKDLGADVDLVGPGPAYERWKQTPEYQQWLKDTGQVK